LGKLKKETIKVFARMKLPGGRLMISCAKGLS
jgi:hypothetical protein